MTDNIDKEIVEAYIRDLVPKKDGLLKELEEYAEEYSIPIIDREVGQFIHVLLNIHRPKRILEIGTAISYSALLMAEALDGNCQIKTIERNPSMIKLARENIDRSLYKDKIQLIEGDAKDILKDLEGPFDLIFLDGAKGQYPNFFSHAKRLVSPKGILLSDNVLFKGMVASDKYLIRRKKTIVKRLREYLKQINEEEGFISSIIPIGDGIALSYRKEG